MSVYLQCDKNGDTIQVGSNAGWGEFGDWIEEHDSPLTRELFDTGASEDFDGVREELEKLLDENEPENPDVTSVVNQIIHAIDAGDPSDVILITCGVTT